MLIRALLVVPVLVQAVQAQALQAATEAQIRA